MSDQTQLHEFSGHVTKEEVLKTVNQNITQGTMVFETKNPFSGYYSQEPADDVPHTYFLFLKTDYSYVEIERAVTKIKKYLGIDFDAAKAEVSFHNTPHPTVRLYFLKDISLLGKIQKAFIDEGIKMKSKSSSFEGTCRICTQKVFLVEDAGDGIYLNRGKSRMVYLTINKTLNWTAFTSATQKVKNNWDGNIFDAASGVFQRRSGIQEIVRIFEPGIDVETAKKLQKAYNSAIEAL